MRKPRPDTAYFAVDDDGSPILSTARWYPTGFDRLRLRFRVAKYRLVPVVGKKKRKLK